MLAVLLRLCNQLRDLRPFTSFSILRKNSNTLSQPSFSIIDTILIEKVNFSNYEYTEDSHTWKETSFFCFKDLLLSQRNAIDLKTEELSSEISATSFSGS